MTTPTDPAAIDPTAIDLYTSRRRLHKSNAWPEIKPIIAAVDALRDEVGGLSIDLVNSGSDNEELRERVATLEAGLDEIAQAAAGSWAAERARAALSATPAEAVEDAERSGTRKSDLAVCEPPKSGDS